MMIYIYIYIKLNIKKIQTKNKKSFVWFLMTSVFSEVKYIKGLSDIGYYQKSTNATLRRIILIYENYTSNNEDAVMVCPDILKMNYWCY